MEPLNTAQVLLISLGVDAVRYTKTGKSAHYTKKGPGRRHDHVPVKEKLARKLATGA